MPEIINVQFTIHLQNVFCFRMPLDHINTSIEEEVFNTLIYGHDEEDAENEMPDGDGNQETGSNENLAVQKITPDEAIKMEKCIVFTDTLLLLLEELHGSICKRPAFDRDLEYRKNKII